MKCSLYSSNFLEDISSLSHSIVFLYFLHWSLRKASYLSLLFFGTLHSDGCIFPFLLGPLLRLNHCLFYCCRCVLSRLVVYDSLRPHGLYSLPGSSVHGIFQARILEWVAIFFPRGCSWTRGRTHVSCRFFTAEPPGKPMWGYRQL